MKRKRIDFQIGKASKRHKVDNVYKKPDFSKLTKKYPDFLRKLLLISGDETSTNEQNKICGIDIGTGASAIYALLGKSVYNWSFIGTEIDPKAIEIAQKIIDSNGPDYKESIRFIHVKNPKHILQPNILPTSPHQFTFCMCNPPFFSNREEGERNHPRRVCKATHNELVTEGGEVEFVKTMIDDSLVLKDRIRWYSSMLGRSSSLEPVLDYLRSKNITNFVTSEFHQGKSSIIRYAVAWNFFHPRPIWIREEKEMTIEILRFFKPQWKLVGNVESEIEKSHLGRMFHTSYHPNNNMMLCLRVKGSQERINVAVNPGTVKYSYRINMVSDFKFVTYPFQDLYEHLTSVFKK